MANISHPRKKGHVGNLLNLNAPCKDISTKFDQEGKSGNLTFQKAKSTRKKHVTTPNVRIQELEILKTPRRIAILRANGLLSPSTSAKMIQPKSYKTRVPSQSPSNESLKGSVASSRSQSPSHQKGSGDRFITNHKSHQAPSDTNLDIPNLEKTLPLKSDFIQESAEHRGILDAADSTSVVLLERFPLLQPMNPHESGNPALDSPNSYETSSSLFSASDRSLDSVGDVGCDTRATSIQQVSKARAGFNLKHPRGTKTTLMREKLSKSSPGSILITPPKSRDFSNTRNTTVKKQHSLPSPDSIQNNGSPSKPACSPLHAKSSNRLVPGGNQTDGNYEHNYTPPVQAKRQKQPNSLKRKGIQFATPHQMQGREALFKTSSSISCGEDTTERSTKYGYNIRQTFDAHEVIMGEIVARELEIKLTSPGDGGKGKEKSQGDIDSNNFSSKLDTDNTIPVIRRVKKQAELNKEHQPRRGAKEMSCAVSIKPQNKTSHQSRCFSPPGVLGATGNSVQLGFALSAEENILEGEGQHPSGSSPATEAANGCHTPRVPLFNRHTTSSAARKSTKSDMGKSTAPSNIRAIQSSHKSNHGSLGNVGKGMKKFSVKVSNIISGRRATTVTSAINTGCGTLENSIFASGIHRQCSPLLTTYKESGIDSPASNNVERPLANDQYSPKAVEAQSSLNNNLPRRRIFQKADDCVRPSEDMAAWHTDARLNAIDELAAQGRSVDQETFDRLPPQGPNAQNKDQKPNQRIDIAASSLRHRQNRGILAGSNFGVATRHEDATDSLLRFVDANVRQWLLRAREMEESPVRNYLIEAATQTGDGLAMAREVRMASLRLGQILHGLAGQLADSAVGVATTFNIYPRQ